MDIRLNFSWFPGESEQILLRFADELRSAPEQIYNLIAAVCSRSTVPTYTATHCEPVWEFDDTQSCLQRINNIVSTIPSYDLARELSTTMLQSEKVQVKRRLLWDLIVNREKQSITISNANALGA